MLVKEALHQRAKGSGQGLAYIASVLLIDTDRLDDRSPNSARAKVEAEQADLQLIRQRPRFEGVLLRLHDGYERAFLSETETDVRLRRVWPKYDKGRVTRYELRQRFTHADLKRAASWDEGLETLVALLGL